MRGGKASKSFKEHLTLFPGSISWAPKFPHSSYTKIQFSFFTLLPNWCLLNNSFLSLFLDPLFKDEWNENVYAISSEDRRFILAMSEKKKKVEGKKQTFAAAIHIRRNYACLWVCDRSLCGSKREREKNIYLSFDYVNVCFFFSFLSRTWSSLEFECLHTIDTWILYFLPFQLFFYLHIIKVCYIIISLHPAQSVIEKCIVKKSKQNNNVSVFLLLLFFFIGCGLFSP